LRHDSVSEAHFKDASLFKPERWLAATAPIDKRVSTPFGSGPRTCPGRYLALLEIKMAAAMLLSRFTLLGVATSDNTPVKERFGFVMSPHDLQMRLAAIAP
jgi:cytochrome P450